VSPRWRHLGDEVTGKGAGVTRICSSCGHKWYLNRKIHACKCQTCSANKQSLLDTLIASSYNNLCAEVAQSVEQRTENPRVPSSILGLGTIRAELVQR
jgi:hypothetical protein